MGWYASTVSYAHAAAPHCRTAAKVAGATSFLGILVAIVLDRSEPGLLGLFLFGVGWFMLALSIALDNLRPPRKPRTTYPRLEYWLGTLREANMFALIMLTGSAGLFTAVPILDRVQPFRHVVNLFLMLSVGLMFIILALLAIRWRLVAFIFARFSLRQVLLLIISGNALVCAALYLPQPLPPIALIILFGLVVWVFFDVLSQDPSGENYVPTFIQEAPRKARRAERSRS